MKIWMAVRIVLVGLGFVQGLQTGMTMALPPLPASELLPMLGLSVLGLLFVVGLQAANPWSAPVWRYPSWSICPFLFKEPLQFFHSGGHTLLATGAGIVLGDVLSGRAVTGSALAVPGFGAALLGGVYACTLVYRYKMAGHEVGSNSARWLALVYAFGFAVLMVVMGKIFVALQPTRAARTAGATHSAPAARTAGATSDLRAGYALYKKGDMRGAIRVYSKVVEQVPDSAEPYYYRALAYAHLGNTGAAEADLRKSIAIRPDWETALDHLAWIYLQTRDYAAARPLLDRLIELDPHEGRYFLNRGGVRHSLGDDAGALADVKRGCTLGYAPACGMLERLGTTVPSATRGAAQGAGGTVKP